MVWVARMNEEAVSVVRAQLDNAAFDEAWEKGERRTADAAVGLALDCHTEQLGDLPRLLGLAITQSSPKERSASDQMGVCR